MEDAGSSGHLGMAAMLICGLRSRHLTAKTREKGGRRGLGPWLLRCLSQVLLEGEERMLRLLSIGVQILRTFHRWGDHVFIMYIVPNLRIARIARILSYWMRCFLPLSNEILKEKRLSRIILLSYLMRPDL